MKKGLVVIAFLMFFVAQSVFAESLVDPRNQNYRSLWNNGKRFRSVDEFSKAIDYKQRVDFYKRGWVSFTPKTRLDGKPWGLWVTNDGRVFWQDGQAIYDAGRR